MINSSGGKSVPRPPGNVISTEKGIKNKVRKNKLLKSTTATNPIKTTTGNNAKK